MKNPKLEWSKFLGELKKAKILIARITDKTVAHPFPPAPTCANHTAVVNVGSNTVFAVGLAMARIGDSADAGAMTTGSDTVFAGG